VDSSSLRAAFHEEELTLARKRLVLVCAFSVGILGSFVVLRYFLNPDDFQATADIRLGFLGVAATFLGLALYKGFRRAAFIIAILVMACDVGYLEMLIVAGSSPEPRQFHGLMVLAPTMALFLPLRAGHCIAFVIITVVGHAIGFNVAAHPSSAHLGA
jgi:hypothetical protein